MIVNIVVKVLIVPSNSIERDKKEYLSYNIKTILSGSLLEDNAATLLNHIHSGFIDEIRLEIRIGNRHIGVEAVPTKEVQFAPLFIASPSIIALFHLSH